MIPNSMTLYRYVALMKTWQLVAIMGSVVGVGIGVILAITNPDQAAYEQFAAKQMADYVGQNLCAKDAQSLGLHQECEELLQSNHGIIQRIIARNTERQNFMFFSIYRTDLELTILLPAYRFETVGALEQFRIYKSEKK